MSRIITIFFWICLVKTSFAQKNIDGLIQAEKNFANYSVTHGTREAFLHFLDSSGIIFEQGKAVNGLQTWSARESRSGRLNWHPEYAEIAASGDFGYTTGPWTFQSAPGDTTIAARGQYVTVWHMNNNGEWKFLVDLGVRNEIPVTLKALKKIFPQKIKVNGLAGKEKLISPEKTFIKSYQQKGSRAYANFLSNQSILNRNNFLPALTLHDQQTILDSLPLHIIYTIQGFGNCSSGDLVYVYGDTELNEKKDNYLRIWRLQKDGWKIALEVLRY
jgi:Domain of unknown function (DUF4440)